MTAYTRRGNRFRMILHRSSSIPKRRGPEWADVPDRQLSESLIKQTDASYYHLRKTRELSRISSREVITLQTFPNRRIGVTNFWPVIAVASRLL